MRAMGYVVVFCSLALGAATRTVVIVGEISDSQCVFNVHSNASSHDDAIKSKVLGSTPQECTRHCVRIGGKYALVDAAHAQAYHLANPKVAEPFAGKRVRIKGTLGADGLLTIHSIRLE
jgi:hypothetical protein